MRPIVQSNAHRISFVGLILGRPPYLLIILAATRTTFDRAIAAALSSTGASTEPVPELQILKEESKAISRGLHPVRGSRSHKPLPTSTSEGIRHSGAPDFPTVLYRLLVTQLTRAAFNVSVRGDNQLVANKLLVMIDGTAPSMTMPMAGFANYSYSGD